MKWACLLSLGAGVICCRRRGNPFRPTELGRLPFLILAKPVEFAPVYPAFDAGVAAEQRSQPAGWASRMEAGVLKLLGALVVLTVVACGFGAQHVAYTREKKNLGRQLRQKELELRTVTQAYRSLETEKALLVAQGVPQTTVNLAKVDSVQRAAVGTLHA